MHGIAHTKFLSLCVGNKLAGTHFIVMTIHRKCMNIILLYGSLGVFLSWLVILILSDRKNVMLMNVTLLTRFVYVKKNFYLKCSPQFAHRWYFFFLLRSLTNKLNNEMRIDKGLHHISVLKGLTKLPKKKQDQVNGIFNFIHLIIFSFLYLYLLFLTLLNWKIIKFLCLTMCVVVFVLFCIWFYFNWVHLVWCNDKVASVFIVEI